MSFVVAPHQISGSPLMSPAIPVVYVVDDDISVREALELLIGLEGWQVELFQSARQFLAAPAKPVPGCLVLDVNLPDLNGLELQRELAATRPEMPIIFITGYGDVPMTVRAMKAGAVEFLQKPFAEDVLLRAIASAIERSRAALPMASVAHELRARFDSLSPREHEVMELIASGLMNKQVGGKLGISEITVKAHRGRVMAKMQARSFADLLKMAAHLGLKTGSGR